MLPRVTVEDGIYAQHLSFTCKYIQSNALPSMCGKPRKNDLIICSIKYFFTLKLIELNLYIMNVAAQINSYTLTHTEIIHINLVYNCVMYVFSK